MSDQSSCLYGPASGLCGDSRCGDKIRRDVVVTNLSPQRPDRTLTLTLIHGKDCIRVRVRGCSGRCGDKSGRCGDRFVTTTSLQILSPQRLSPQRPVAPSPQGLWFRFAAPFGRTLPAAGWLRDETFLDEMSIS